MKILYLYPDLMNLYGESGNLCALERRLADQGEDVSVDRKAPGEALEIAAYDWIYMGAGTSGRLGVLDASECPPTFGVSPELVQGIIAGGDTALRNAVEGAEDSGELAVADLKARSLTENDVVVAISASGYAPYCVAALDYAREIGALAVAMSCNTGANTSSHADIAIEAPTGSEVLSGSTRLKAGTATKITNTASGTMARWQTRANPSNDGMR